MKKPATRKTAIKKTWWVPILFLLTIAALAAVSPETPAQDPTPAATPQATGESSAASTNEPPEAQPPQAQPPQAQPPQAQPPQAQPPDDGTDDGELDTFIPSEKLPADSAISFPVDI